MIEPSGISQFTGDFDQLDKDTSGLRSDAIGIRNGGMDVHSRFQMLGAFYTAPEAADLFATTQPVMDKADDFATKLETVADALDTYSIEARPLAKKLAQLKTDAFAFVDSIEGDDDWTYDGDKIHRHQELMDGVASAESAFREAERRAATKISALVGGPKFVVDDGHHTVNKKTVMYGYGLDVLKQAKDTPWGSPESESHHAWEVGYWAKSYVWDGLVVDNIWGSIKGLGTLAGFNGWGKAGDAWSNLGDAISGIGQYTMKPYDALMDWAFGPDKESATEVRQKKAARELGKSFVGWDMWKENPARAAATVTFNVFTLGAGPLAVAAKGGKAGAVAKTAATAAKIGEYIDPVAVGLRATGRAASKLPKLSDLTATIRAGIGASTESGRLHSVIELDDGSKVVVENGEFVAYDRHGNDIGEAPMQERSVTGTEATPEQVPVRERELAEVGATSRASEATAHAGNNHPPGASHKTPSGRSGGTARAVDTDASGSGVGTTRSSHAGTGSGDAPEVRSGAHRPEHVSGSGRSESVGPDELPHGHGAAHTDTQEPHEGHEEPGADGDTDSASAAHQHGGGDGEPDFTRPTLPPGQAELSLRELRALRAGRHRYTTAEEIGREMFGGGPERHYRVPTHDHPYYPVEAPGGRKVDVPVDLPGGRTLAVEIKHYLEFRTVKLADGTNQVVKGEVPLSKGIIEQINKDLTLRRLDPKYDPRWVFLHAPPSQALRNYLIEARVIFVEYGPAPKK
ncbi:hypothetical protein [Streptomyces sp. NPDC055400]